MLFYFNSLSLALWRLWLNIIIIIYGNHGQIKLILITCMKNAILIV